MMSNVQVIDIPVIPRFENTKTSATGYLINNVLPEREFETLLKFWEHSRVHGVDWDQSVYYFKGKKYSVGNQRTFGTLYDRKLFDLTENPEWYYQTPQTILPWYNKLSLATIHPFLILLSKRIKSLPPFNTCPDEWVFIRSIINVLIYEQLLTLHVDSAPSIFNCPIEDAREYSITIYLNSVSHGGEFWIDSDPGFVYSPVPNSAFIFPGGHIFHGVNQNRDENKTTRKAITFRVCHVDSLHLPGDPSKFVIKNPLLCDT